jgi:thiamine-phosphate pyrophosphorylase
MSPVNFRILLVTDRHQAHASLPAVLLEAALGGVRAVQVRERDMPSRALLALVQEIQESIKPHGVRLIMNDRLDLVLALDLDGVHLRGNSVPTPVARRLLGPHRLVGVSTHSVAAVRQANEEGADYVVFGPIFETPSKRPFGPPLGLDALATACAASQIPVFAIGGITLERLSEVCGEGAHGVAVIGAILMRDDVAAAARGLCAEMTKIKIGWRTMSDR